MSTPGPNESTPLLATERTISADHSLPTSYHSRKKGFHVCCYLGLAVLIALTIAAIISVYFIVEHEKKSEDTNTGIDSLNKLLRNSWPLPNANTSDILYTSSFSEIVNAALNWSKRTLHETQAIIEPVKLNSSTSYRNAIAISEIDYNRSISGYVENLATTFLRNNGLTDIIHYDSTNDRNTGSTDVIHYESADDLEWANESGCDKLSERVRCNATAYRSVDGFCNNRNRPKRWGVAMTPFRRSLSPDYEDDVFVPRGGFKTTLPSAHDVSTKVRRSAVLRREDTRFAVMIAVWGQFIDHDVTATALSKGANGETISCCNSNKTHPECFPVLLSEEYEYYSKFNATCMEFVRSAPALQCAFGPREQLNQASSYLDASTIYGNTEESSFRLRTFQDGQLAMSYTNDGRSLLPISTNPIDGCNQADEMKKGRYCFMSGDSRANENVYLTSIHLIFARQHNRIAKQLKELNPHWVDEQLYQESRRIVAAQIQHITYNEFVPIILGLNMTTKLELSPLKNGYWANYNSSVDATVANNFATSSFRFLHTLMPPGTMMKILPNDSNSSEYIETHKMLFDSFALREGELDSIIRDATTSTKTEKTDNYLWTQSEQPHSAPVRGLDLVALNIQRGRDHGLPSYPRWREYCGFSPVKTFADLKTVFDSESLDVISSVYNSVDDVDLYTGSLFELPIHEGLVGPTMTCLIADQLFRLKYGDRFWYETDERPQAFTIDQLAEIRKTSLAGVICQNADDLQYVTREAMRSVGEFNARTKCSDVPQPNITRWTDTILRAERTDKSRTITVDDYDRISAHIVRSESSNTRSLNDDDDDDSAEDFCETKLQAIALEIRTGTKTYNISLLRQDAYSSLVTVFPSIVSRTVFVWKPTSANTIAGYFAANNTNFTFALKYENETSDCVDLRKNECVYYSKAVLDETLPRRTFFEIDANADVGQCTVIAPVLLHEARLTSNGTFLRNNTLTILRRKATKFSSFKKEDELSLHLTPKHVVDLANIRGTGKIALDDDDFVFWNDSLPTVFELSTLNWFAGNNTIVYVVSWSGFYVAGGDKFVGDFLLPERRPNGTIRWHAGEFSIDVSSMPNITRYVRPRRVYYSIVYLTNDEKVDDFDPSELRNLDDWDFDAYSQMLLFGNFTDVGFEWSGSMQMIVPQEEQTPVRTRTSYRPDGKYVGAVTAANVYTRLSNRGRTTVWSGTLPDTVEISETLVDKVMVWSYDKTNVSFSTLGNVNLFGNFRFNFTSLLPNVTAANYLRPNVTYYSPISFQRDERRPTYELNEDLSEDSMFKRLYGIFAPVKLFGSYHKNSSIFVWNRRFAISLPSQR